MVRVWAYERVQEEVRGAAPEQLRGERRRGDASLRAATPRGGVEAGCRTQNCHHYISTAACEEKSAMTKQRWVMRQTWPSRNRRWKRGIQVERRRAQPCVELGQQQLRLKRL